MTTHEGSFAQRMTIPINLPPDVADRLSRKAAQDGQDIPGYMRQIALREAALWDAPTLTAWDALLDSFSGGDSEDHRETVETLARALNEDRPGQRRVFGAGVNPAESAL